MKIAEPIAMFVFACAGPAASAAVAGYGSWWLGGLTLALWSWLLALWLRRMAREAAKDEYP